MDAKVFLMAGYGAATAICEVLDSENEGDKLFLFRENPCDKHYSGRQCEITKISVYSRVPKDEFDYDGVTIGPSYRVCARPEPPPGYLLALEGTLKPEEKPIEPPAVERDPRIGRCEEAIVAALKDGRMLMRALRRKVHADRYGSAVWDSCLDELVQYGEIIIEAGEPTWVRVGTN